MVTPQAGVIPTLLPRSPWRSVAVWLAVVLIIYMFFNTMRAVLNPAAFAEYYGLPLAPGNNAFVYVYAIRSLFLGLFGLLLLLRKEYRALAAYVLVATIMPVGDAGLVAFEGGPIVIIVRHGITAGFLVVSGFLLRRWANAVQP